MKEFNNQSLESLIETVTNSPLPYWAKTTISVTASLTPLIRILVPLIMTRLFVDLILKLAGL